MRRWEEADFHVDADVCVSREIVLGRDNVETMLQGKLRELENLQPIGCRTVLVISGVSRAGRAVLEGPGDAKLLRTCFRRSSVRRMAAMEPGRSNLSQVLSLASPRAFKEAVQAHPIRNIRCSRQPIAAILIVALEYLSLPPSSVGCSVLTANLRN